MNRGSHGSPPLPQVCWNVQDGFFAGLSVSCFNELKEIPILEVLGDERFDDHNFSKLTLHISTVNFEYNPTIKVHLYQRQQSLNLQSLDFLNGCSHFP